MCTAACPGCTYSASTAEIPSGCRVILGFTDFEFMDECVSGTIATFRPISTWDRWANQTSPGPSAAIPSAAAVIALAALPTQAQQAAPVRQEHGNLIFEGIPP